MIDFNLDNKVAVITGGANGIGFAIAKEFLKKNAKTVILLDISDKGNEAVEKLNSKYGSQKTIFMKCDVTSDIDPVSSNIFAVYKKIDIFVNSAGVVNEESIRITMEINSIAVIEWSMKFYEHMSKHNGGAIINISSNYGVRIDQFAPFYKASKFAIVGFSRTLGHECNFKKSGVKVVVICPGFTRTNLGHGPGNVCVMQEGFDELLKNAILQDPDAVGKAAVHVIEQGNSGTAWLVEEGKWTELP